MAEVCVTKSHRRPDSPQFIRRYPIAFRDTLAARHHRPHERGHFTGHGQPLPDVRMRLADQCNWWKKRLFLLRREGAGRKRRLSEGSES